MITEIEVDKELIHQIEHFIKTDPKKRYDSKEDFIREALRRLAQKYIPLVASE